MRVLNPCVCWIVCGQTCPKEHWWLNMVVQLNMIVGSVLGILLATVVDGKPLSMKLKSDSVPEGVVILCLDDLKDYVSRDDFVLLAGEAKLNRSKGREIDNQKTNLQGHGNSHDLILSVNKAIGIDLLEGDIKSLPLRYRTAVSDRSRLWPNTTIPYTLDKNYDHDEIMSVLAALKELHDKTCIRFVPRKDETDYVYFVQHKGCYSSVGRTGDQQEVTLEKPCLTPGTALHEILHALGFWHEHNRSDRDSYIQIMWNNIEEGREFNFEKYPIRDVDVLGAPYDYDSVMHYSQTAFSKNGRSTIRPVWPTTTILGQRNYLSVIDAWKVNKLYKCLPSQRTTPLNTPATQSTLAPSSKKPAIPALILVPSHHLPPSLNNSSEGHNVMATRPHLVHHPRTPPPLPQKYAWGPYSDWSPCDIHCQAKRTRICLDFIRQVCGQGSSSQMMMCPPPCRAAEYIGCWKNDPHNPAIPMIENQRSATMEFHTLEAYRECADAAMEMGYPVFALFRDGDCLTGPDALENFAKYGQSSVCGRNGRGSDAAMDVYTYIKNIDGSWSMWGEWETCSQRCGNGTRMRRRFCSNPPSLGNGKMCQGHREESESCNPDPCQDIDGGWSSWTLWTGCSRLCGVGLQYRNRKCDTPKPSGAGADCAGFDVDTKHCVLKDCSQSNNCGSEAHYGTHGHINQAVYDSAMSCEYHVSTYTGTSILLQVDRMDIENSAACKDDMLMVFDGNSTKSKVLATMCGHFKHAPIRSSGSDLTVLFESDTTIGGSGYTLSWHVTHSLYHMCPKPIGPLHGSMSGSTTYIGDQFRFMCDLDYHLIGPSVITCLSYDQYHAVWDSGFPRCEKSVKSDLPVIEIG